jgi:diguanylate cyclase (GGDEF)-like protein
LSADVECENGVPVRIFGLKQDITQEKDLLDRLRRSAECDPLTGIANRAVFQSRILQSPKSGPHGRPLAALFLVDLDGFKRINDTVGHSAGDECLKQVAERLQRAFEPGTLVARIGGDEFAILIYGSHERKKIERDARRVISQIKRFIMWNEQSLIVGASIGIAILEDSIVVPSRLFIEADVALYAAKNAGRNTFRIFDSELRQKPDPSGSSKKKLTVARRPNGKNE